MTNQTGTIRIALLIIIVALVAALVYVVAVPKSERNGTRATGDEIADWKTYRSEKFGFELKHSSDWLVYEDDTSVTFTTKEKEERDRVVNEELYQKYCKNDDCGPLEFDNSGIEFFLDDRPDAEEINLSRQTEVVRLGPDNLEWDRYIIEAGHTVVRYVAKSNQKLFIFTVYPQYEAELKNLLSTFKFTE